MIATMSLLAACSGAASAAGGAPGKSCHLPGAEEALRCLSVAVPLDYSKPQGPTFNLHVTVAPAFRESARADPLFLLPGGPGQAGTDVLFTLGAMRRVRATRDVVFIDQRGTGRSGRMVCADEKNHDTMTEAEAEASLLKCAATQKYPFPTFSTANAAHDMERVRAALGYKTINLLGVSYGTRLAQQYARFYPASVRSIVLDGVVAPDQAIPAGGIDGQAALERMFADCAADQPCRTAFPALRKEYDALNARAAAGIKLDLPDPRTTRPSKVEIDLNGFQKTLHTILYSPLDSRRLPFLINSAYNNRWGPFVARKNIGSDFSPDGDVAVLMHLAVVCAEDLPYLKPAERVNEERMLAGPALERYISLCKLLSVPPAKPQAITPIKAPVLLLSGALDPVTPPRRADAAAKYMTAAQHLVVANAGHGVFQLGCAPRLLREFLDQPGKPVAAACLEEIPAPTFQLGSAGPQP